MGWGKRRAEVGVGYVWEWGLWGCSTYGIWGGECVGSGVGGGYVLGCRASSGGRGVLRWGRDMFRSKGLCRYWSCGMWGV